MKSLNINVAAISGEWYATTDVKGNIVTPVTYVSEAEMVMLNTTDIAGNVIMLAYTGNTEQECQQKLLKGIDGLIEESTIRGNLMPYNGIDRTYAVGAFPNFDTIHKLISIVIYVNHAQHPPMDGIVTVHAKGDDFIPQLGTNVFDYLWNKLITGTPISDIIQEGVMFADMDGTINAKLYA